MNWKDLAGRFESLGLGILKTAITAQAGPLVGGLVAGVLDTVATPEAVDAAIEADPVAATETLKPVQTEAAVIAAYESAAARAAETNTTMRAEAASGDPVQRWWRPAFAVVTMLQVAADQMVANAVPAGQGHEFGQEPARAWAAILPPSGWSADDTERLVTQMEELAPSRVE